VIRLGQAAPTLPGTNILAAVDSISQTLYTALATDPILGTFAKILPPPPKVSQLALPGILGRTLPPFPTLPIPGSREAVTTQTGARARSPFT
jgi:hypothetical protein